MRNKFSVILVLYFGSSSNMNCNYIDENVLNIDTLSTAFTRGPGDSQLSCINSEMFLVGPLRQPVKTIFEGFLLRRTRREL